MRAYLCLAFTWVFCPLMVAASVYAETLYGVNQYGAVYDLNNVVAGNTTIGSLVRPSLPGVIQSEVVGNVRSIEYADNAFVVGAQKSPPASGQYGKLFRFGFATGGEQFVGKIGVGSTYYYSPLALAKTSQGDLYVSFSQTSGDRADTIGKVSPTTAQIDASTIKTANPSTLADYIDGMAFDSSGNLFAQSSTYFQPPPVTTYFFNFNLSNGAVTPYCSTNPCWYVTQGGASAVAINTTTNTKIVAKASGGGTSFYRVDLTSNPYTTTLVYLGNIENVAIGGLTYGPDVQPPYPPARECDYKVINDVVVCL